ncbi:MAG: rhodanese-like domain-containing protein [Planctomycetaceae bacterium]|nr:rhodanese-like domain-containing protein [Planctomycetaceae bacterium]
MLFSTVLRIALCFLAMGAAPLHAIEFTEDSLKAVLKAVDEKRAALVDVRSQKEWDKGHVAGAIFLPATALTDDLDEQKLGKALPKKGIYYIHCAVGIRATRAGDYLEKRGYQVKVLKPGYQQLIEAGFKPATEKDEKKK